MRLSAPTPSTSMPILVGGTVSLMLRRGRRFFLLHVCRVARLGLWQRTLLAALRGCHFLLFLAWSCNRNFRRLCCSEARCAFLRFRFPIRAAKPFRRCQVPSPGIGSVAAGFKVARQFERHHRVASLRKQTGELPGRVLARSRPPYAGGDLFPVRHTRTGF